MHKGDRIRIIEEGNEYRGWEGEVMDCTDPNYVKVMLKGGMKGVFSMNSLEITEEYKQDWSNRFEDWWEQYGSLIYDDPHTMAHEAFLAGVDEGIKR